MGCVVLFSSAACDFCCAADGQLAVQTGAQLGPGNTARQHRYVSAGIHYRQKIRMCWCTEEMTVPCM